MGSEMNIKYLENTIDDLISDFLYYDRKEDEDLLVGDIEKWIKEDSKNKDRLIMMFIQKLDENL